MSETGFKGQESEEEDGMADNPNVEESKSNIDYLKHITALSTGSIVLLAAFLEKNFPNPQWKYLVVWAYVGFIVCVIASAISHLFIIARFSVKDSYLITPYILLVAILGFLTGTLMLTVFAVKNINQPPESQSGAPPSHSVCPPTSESPAPSSGSQGNAGSRPATKKE